MKTLLQHPVAPIFLLQVSLCRVPKLFQIFVDLLLGHQACQVLISALLQDHDQLRLLVNARVEKRRLRLLKVGDIPQFGEFLADLEHGLKKEGLLSWPSKKLRGEDSLCLTTQICHSPWSAPSLREKKNEGVSCVLPSLFTSSTENETIQPSELLPMRFQLPNACLCKWAGPLSSRRWKRRVLKPDMFF